MPMMQVYVLYAHRHYLQLQDDLFKWYALPYFQAIAGLNASDARMKEHKMRLATQPFFELLPAIAKVYSASARLDRRIAAQRCIEAIRLYAANHDGKLPGTLADITEVPLPDDPMLGKPFDYKSAGDQATLHAAAPEGTPSGATLTYELTLKP
jgi:hypothetical protein